MSTSALTQELHALFRSPGGLQPAGRQDCRRIILELIKLSHQPNEEGNECASAAIVAAQHEATVFPRTERFLRLFFRASHAFLIGTYLL